MLLATGQHTSFIRSRLQYPVAIHIALGAHFHVSYAYSRARSLYAAALATVARRIAMVLVMSGMFAPAMASGDYMRFERLLGGESLGSDAGVGALKDIIQDADGFMWFATENGVARYDGHEFRYYYSDREQADSISGDFVAHLFIDHRDELWLATTGGLNRYHPQLDRFSKVVTIAEKHERNDHVIFGLAEDSLHNLYLATNKGLTVLDPERRLLHNFRHNPDDPHSIATDNLRAVYVDSKDRVWLGGITGSLNQFDLASQRFIHWPYNPENDASVAHDHIERFAEDAEGYLWIATHGGGLSRLQVEGKQFRNYRYNSDDASSIGSNTLRDVFVDSHNNLWVATDHAGLALYDRENDAFTHFRHDSYDTKSLNSDQVRTIYEDRTGNLWVGNFPGGVNFYDRSKSVFKYLRHHPEDPLSLSHNAVLSIIKDRRGTFWVGTEKGLNAWDPQAQTMRRYLHDPKDPFSLRFNAVTSVAEDLEGVLWVATWSGGLHRFERESEKFYAYLPEAGNEQSVSSEYVWQLAVDKDNTLWIGTTEGAGLSKMDSSRTHFSRYGHDANNDNSLSYNHIWAITLDSKNDLWLATLNGLNHFQPEREQFVHYFADAARDDWISSNNITAIKEMSDRRIWLGTDDGKVNILDRERKTFTKLTRDHGLPGARISSVIEDKDGYVWVGTSNGLARIDPISHEIRRLQSSDGLIGNNHNRNAVMMDEAGILYFGSTQGITYFDPHAAFSNHSPPNPTFTKLKISDQVVSPASHPEVLQQAIEKAQRIKLDYEQNIFSLEFSALSFRSSFRNHYSYKLEGFDENWTAASMTRSATYTNIDPGTYNFKVRAANSSGQWSEHPASIIITITPPPWRSGIAYALYALLILLASFLFIHFQSKRIELKKEKIINLRLLNLDRIKDAFLANTSHELRTPLNGIIGLSENIIEGATGGVNAETRETLEMIVASGKRLAGLVNDILDHSKLSDSTLEIHRQPVSVRATVAQVFALLGPLAQEKSITLHNNIPLAAPTVAADANRLQQILINIIGNGIKYADQGRISCTCRSLVDQLEIAVTDDGPGIPEHELQTVFDAFKQLQNGSNRSQGGTGLGLAITKQLVQLHGGTIWVESGASHGAVFKFTMPIAHGRAAEPMPDAPSASLLLNAMQAEAALSAIPTHEAPASIPPLANAAAYTILVVDDDAINRMVLTSILQHHHYQVVEAKNGEQALAVVDSGLPIDLVLLDIMMPQMSGYEICSIIRQRHSATALPVMFLTAKRAEDELTKGFEAGGNELLTKPVAKGELLAKVRKYLLLKEA